MTTRLWALFLFAATLCCFCSAQSPGAALDGKLHATVQNYSISSSNLLEALAQLSDDFQLRMGIEWDLSSVENRKVALKFGNAMVSEIVRDVVSTEPHYSFTTANGVIHIGNKGVSEDVRNFLNLRIGDFQVSSEYVVHASNRLSGIVANLATAPGAEGMSYGCAGSFGVGAGDHVTSFRLQNATVRDILDRFVESAGFNIWLVTFPEAQQPAQGAMLKTASIFDPARTQSDIPTWDLLLPGYDPVRKGFGLGWRRGGWQPVADGVPH